MQHLQHGLAWWPTLIVLAVAVVTDLRRRRIPNWLVLPFLLAGIVISPLRSDWDGVGQGFWLRTDWAGIRHGFWHGLGQSFAGAGLGILIFGIFLWMGGMGAGDVKLCAAIGAWIGPAQLLLALVLTAMAGGIMVLCWITYRKVLKRLLLGAGDLIFGRNPDGIGRDPETSIADMLKRKMPYAPAIAIGTLISFFAAP
ncbi:MAG: prepilin peptidase [Terracidiphilus sp.]|jgi:prepilin peptidase CpaA